MQFCFLSCVLHITPLSFFLILYDNILCGVITKFIIMQLSPFPCHLFVSYPDAVLFNLFSFTLNLWSSFRAREQVSHLHKSTGRTTPTKLVLYVLIFGLLDRTRGDEMLTSIHKLDTTPSQCLQNRDAEIN